MMPLYFAKAHNVYADKYFCEKGSLVGIMKVDSGELPYLPLCLNKNEGAKLIYIQW